MNEPATIDLAASIEGQRLSWFLIQLVLVSWIVTFFDGFDMNVIAFVAPYLSSEFHLDKSMLGNIFSIGLVGTMIGGFAFGWLGDRIGRRPTMILSTALFGGLTLAFALAASYGQLLLLRLLDGIAIGGMLPLCWALNIEYAPTRFRATIVTVIMVGYSMGSSLGGPIAVWLIPRFGWSSVYIFGGAASLLAALLLLAVLPESLRFMVGRNEAPARIARALRRMLPGCAVPAGARFIDSVETERRAGARNFRIGLLFKDALRWVTPLFWLAYIASSMTAFFLATWTPLVFEALGFSRTDAAWAVSINSAGGALGGLLLMRFTDNRGPISITAMPLMAVPLLLLAGLADLAHPVFLVLNFFIVLFLIGGHFGLHSTAGLFYPSAYRGNGAGWATSVAKIGSIAGPFVGGLVLSSHLPTRAVFAVLAICPAVFALSIFAVGRIWAHVWHRQTIEAAIVTAQPEAA
ncbi:MAG: MFS transporter [Acetobacteraceae bacterium]|nr:MFS transporter [Acetobacteraceae bacterium]